MCSRDCSTATCWRWSIFAGSTRLKTPPTPALASASVTWPSESSWTCCSFSWVVIFASRASTLASTPWLGAVRVGARAASSCDGGELGELLATEATATTVAAARGGGGGGRGRLVLRRGGAGGAAGHRGDGHDRGGGEGGADDALLHAGQPPSRNPVAFREVPLRVTRQSGRTGRPRDR